MPTFIEQELEDHEEIDTDPRFLRNMTFRTILCSKLNKGLSLILIIAITVPTLAYFFIISSDVSKNDDTEQYYCLIREEFRVPCGNADITKSDCQLANCCYNSTTRQCYHFLPSKYYYRAKGNGLYVTSQLKSPVGSVSLPNINLTIQNKTSNKVSLIIHDPSEKVESMSTKKPNYSIVQSTKKLILEVYDQDGDIIFTTAKSALIASKHYWEWSFQLSNGSLFGLDRNLIQLDPAETLTKVIYKNENDHFTMPVFWAYQNGKFHGAIIKHDGPLEIQVTASNMIILRSLLGKKIEVELSLGPTPTDLYIDQTMNMTVPPRWTLDTHNCRRGNSTSLSEILSIFEDNKAPSFGTDCIHENLFIALQKSNNSKKDLDRLAEHIKEINDTGRKFVFSLPPHILIDNGNTLYTEAHKYNMLYKYQSGIVYNGTYLKHPVVYSDFSSSNTSQYIQTLVSWIESKIGLKSISGFVLNDNWPQDDKYRNVEKINFPYYSQAIDAQMLYTLPWTLEGTDHVLHLEKHNSYGQLQKSSLHKYFHNQMGEQPVIVSASKLYRNAEPTISENFDTSWDDFRSYLNKILFNSITGNLMVGLPVCGDYGSYNKTLHETLCMRWYIAAATMPYFQVSSGDVFRNPENLNSRYATNVAETAMSRRNMIQDHLYTILRKKEPVVRPMYYNYYQNSSFFSIEGQYTIGSDIIVAHPLSSRRVKLQVYSPPEKEVWYEFWGGTMFHTSENNPYIEIESTESDWTMLIAQGTVVALTNLCDFQLYIALNCSSVQNGCHASGELYKNGNSLSFSATNTSVTISGLPVTCSYNLVYLRVYTYESKTGYIFDYSKDIPLCKNRLNNITVNYV